MSSKSPTNANSAHEDAQPPLKLTFEEKTPIARWVILAAISLFACSVLTYLINAGNPKITASELEAMAALPTPTATLPVNEAGYSAVLELNPPDHPPTNSNLTLTATLFLHGQPVEGALVHYTLRNFRGELRDVEGGTTGPDGFSVTVYNIGKIFGRIQTRVIAAFLIDGKVVIRTDRYFTPGP